jgi:hypothetical protein
MEKLDYLEKFYNALYNNLIKKYEKEKYKSILVWFMDIKENDRLRIVSESKLKKIRIPKEIFDELFKSDLIRESDIAGEFVITAKGIWEIEAQKSAISQEILLKEMDRKYFSTYNETEKALSDRQKIILMAMIAARTFSDKSPMDLKKGDYALANWEEIINKSYALLHELAVVNSMSDEQIFGKPGNEHKVSNLIRHSDAIPKRTKGIYQAAETRDQKYYLSLANAGKIDLDNLRFIFKQIFADRKLSHSEIDIISSFCNDTASSKNVYLFDLKEHIFHAPEYDNVIRDALLTL